jgi:hypothetical protein
MPDKQSYPAYTAADWFTTRLHMVATIWQAVHMPRIVDAKPHDGRTRFSRSVLGKEAAATGVDLPWPFQLDPLAFQ